MYIISKEKNGSGAYSALQSWSSPNCPDTHWFYPDEFFNIFYPADKRFAGFVDVEVDESKKMVTKVTWNEELYAKFAEEHPEPEPVEPEPSEAEDVNAMLVDQEMRLIVLEAAVNNNNAN